MKGFYIRWGIILLCTLVVTVLAAGRYRMEVSVISPEDLLRQPSEETVRVLGMVEGGSLAVKSPGEATFRLTGEGAGLTVHYKGEGNDNLRELKALVVVGRWAPANAVFEAARIALAPNYGFVVGAYLAGILPAAIFLVGMERRARILYNEIKDTAAYQPEEGFDIRL